MSPGAGERNVEVITAKLGGKASMTRGTGCAIDRDPVAVGAILAQETSSRARRIVPLVAPLAVNQQTHAVSPFLRALPSMRRRSCQSLQPVMSESCTSGDFEQQACSRKIYVRV